MRSRVAVVKNAALVFEEDRLGLDGGFAHRLGDRAIDHDRSLARDGSFP